VASWLNWVRPAARSVAHRGNLRLRRTTAETTTRLRYDVTVVSLRKSTWPTDVLGTSCAS
jgi:hypothetical protein